AYALAQEDQARLRAMRISTLRAIQGESTEAGKEVRKVTTEGTTYTVTSTAKFVNSISGTDIACGGTASADYVRISSEVSWTNMSPIQPQKLASIIALPSGTQAPNSGMLSITITKDSGTGIPSIGLSGARVGGGGSFSGSTDATG